MKRARPRSRARHGAVVTSVLLVTSLYLGCASVPDIRFVSDATDTDADTGSGGEAGRNDANDATVSGDGDAACTTASPGAGATCCGAVWCIGDCNPNNCDECAVSCSSAGEFCCGKTGTVMCKTHCP